MDYLEEVSKYAKLMGINTSDYLPNPVLGNRVVNTESVIVQTSNKKKEVEEVAIDEALDQEDIHYYGCGTGIGGFKRGNLCGVGKRTKFNKFGRSLPFASSIRLLFNISHADKVKLAKTHAVRVDTKIQRFTEEHNQVWLARKLGGRPTIGSKPYDLETRSAIIELKTLFSNTNDKITMDSYSQVLKLKSEEESGKKYHTIVIDAREAWNQNNPSKIDYTKFVYYYRHGIAGSARLANLYRVKTLSELKQLLTTPVGKLPDEAKPTDHDIRLGKWIKGFTKAGEPYFRNTETDRIIKVDG